MPLRDSYGNHSGFRIPVESVWLMWAAALAAQFNRSAHGKRYVAHLGVHGGFNPDELSANVIATRGDWESSDDEPVANFWFKFPAFSPPQCELLVKDLEDELKVVGAIELVLPSTRSNARERQRFVSKCLSFLSSGVGLVVVDAVAGNGKSLHNVLLSCFRAPNSFRLSAEANFAVSYSLLSGDEPEFMFSPHALEVGQPIPSFPLQLLQGPEVLIDLEAAYEQALADLNL